MSEQDIIQASDVALIVDGRIAQVWRDVSIDDVAETLPLGEHELVAFPAGEAVFGLAWDGQTLSAPTSFEASQAAKRAAIDAVFLARTTQDFPFDFADIAARDDLGASVGPAGIRSLQMRDLQDQANWTAAHTVAVAAVATGGGATTVALKCDDNVWVQTSAAEAVVVLASLFQRQAAILARYGHLKKLCADAADQAGLDAIDETAEWPPNLGEV